MPYPGWSKPWERLLVEETEAYLKGYNATREADARANHPSNFRADEEVHPHGEHPDLPEV
jgi:hypothetical protein